jgi:hypothetical protein
MMPFEPIYGAGVPPDNPRFARVRHALELYCQDFPTFVSPDPNPGYPWHDLGLDLLENASYWLRHYYYMPEACAGQEDAIASVQSLSREAAALLAAHPAFTNRFDRFDSETQKPTWGMPGSTVVKGDRRNLVTTKALWGVYWTSTPEEGTEIYRELINSGFMPKLRGYFRQLDFMERPRHDSVVGGMLDDTLSHRPQPLSYLVGWKWQDRKRVVEVWHRFIEQLCSSTDEQTRLEGLFLQCSQARTDDEHDRSLRELLAFVEQRANRALAENRCTNLFEDVDSVIGLQESRAANEEARLALRRTDPARHTRLEIMTNYFNQGRFDSKTFFGDFVNYRFQPDEARL